MNEFPLMLLSVSAINAIFALLPSELGTLYDHPCVEIASNRKVCATVEPDAYWRLLSIDESPAAGAVQETLFVSDAAERCYKAYCAQTDALERYRSREYLLDSPPIGFSPFYSGDTLGIWVVEVEGNDARDSVSSCTNKYFDVYERAVKVHLLRKVGSRKDSVLVDSVITNRYYYLDSGMVCNNRVAKLLQTCEFGHKLRHGGGSCEFRSDFEAWLNDDKSLTLIIKRSLEGRRTYSDCWNYSFLPSAEIRRRPCGW